MSVFVHVQGQNSVHVVVECPLVCPQNFFHPLSSIFSFIQGGPLVNWIPKKSRFFLIGTVSGGFFDCSNILPGIFVQVDEVTVLNFLRKEIFGDDPIQLGIQSSTTTTTTTTSPQTSGM